MENKEEIRFSLNLASVFSSRCLTRFTCAYHVSEFKASIPFHWESIERWISSSSSSLIPFNE